MDRLEKATTAWELLDIYRPLRRLTRAGTTKRVYEPLSELLSELQSLEKSLEQTKQSLEAEEFGIDLPDKTPFDEAQAAANSIESAIEGGL